MKRILTVFIALVAALLCGAYTAAQPIHQTRPPVPSTKPLIEDDSAYINANNIFMSCSNLGLFGTNSNSITGQTGGIFFPFDNNNLTIPNLDSGKTIIWTSGLWLAGLVNDTMRAAIAEYTSEFAPGPMQNGTFLPDEPEFKVYKLYRDSLASNPNADYLNWPLALGAPMSPAGAPVLKGDQTLWMVYNDADTARHTINAGSTLPLGIEIRQTVWAYDEPGSDTIYFTTAYPGVQSQGKSMSATAFIVKPNQLTGHDYDIIIDVTTIPPSWSLADVTAATTLLTGQTDFNGSRDADTTDGFIVSVRDLPDTAIAYSYQSASPLDLSPVATADNPSYGGGQWFKGYDIGGGQLDGGIAMVNGRARFLSTLQPDEYKPVRLDFIPMDDYTDLDGNGRYTIGEPYSISPSDAGQKAFFYTSLMNNGSYAGFYDIPFSAWDISDSANPRQLNVVIRDRDGNDQWDPHYLPVMPDPLIPNGGDTRYNYIWITASDYDSLGTIYGDGTGGSLGFFTSEIDTLQDGMWIVALTPDNTLLNIMLAEGGDLEFVPGYDTLSADTFSFTAAADVFETTSPAGQSVFIEYQIFNKGGKSINDCFVSFWLDPTIGHYGDDLIGCDSTENLFFIYNQNAFDGTFHFFPPAAGVKILAGPAIPSTGDTAYYFGEWIQDYKNQNLSSFVTFPQGAAPQSTAETYNFMQGTYGNGTVYTYLSNPTGYWFSGDPVTGTGDVMPGPGYGLWGFGNCGPFDLAPNDSQYVLLKLSAAQGSDNLAAITNLKRILNEPLMIPTAVDDDIPALPRGFSLEQNYPNPFNPTTTIAFDLPRSSRISLEIFNILGQRVATLIDADYPAGHHQIIWDGTDNDHRAVATGIYFYRLKTDTFIDTKKMLLLK